MSIGSAVTILPVAETCERNDCTQKATVAMIVTGEYGVDGIGAYCDDHAHELEEKDSHTTVGEVKQ
jgi:hypothetical protein